MGDAYECFKVAVADYVAIVMIARPPVNAQNRRFREEIVAIFEKHGFHLGWPLVSLGYDAFRIAPGTAGDRQARGRIRL